MRDRIAADLDLEDALESGDPARIEAAELAYMEAVAVYNEAVAADERNAKAEAEAADWYEPEPEAELGI